MEKVRLPKGQEIEEAQKMSSYILDLLGYKKKITLLGMNEKTRQFFTWGCCKYACFATEKNNIGLQFNVSGLKFKGLVRVIYCYATDYFNIELIKVSRINVLKELNRKLGLKPNEMKLYQEKLTCVKEVKDIDFESLHNILHRLIEREDDPEV